MTCKEKIDEIEKILDDEYETKIERIREVVDDLEDKSISLAKVKQAINEVSKLRLESGVKGNIIDDEIYIDSMDVLNILDKLIAESEEQHG